MNNITTAIQDDIRLGVISFAAIAAKYSVSLSAVNLIWDEMCQQEFA